MSDRRPPLRFGLFIGQVGLTWPELAERFVLADELGFDHAWLVDHLMPTDPPHDRPAFEAWTTLAALAMLTNRIRLGVLVTSNTFRHPSLLAKQAVTIDHISGGRLILGIGTGWYSEEHRQFGLEFPSASVRVERLGEALEVLSRLTTGRVASYEGNHYRLAGALALPRPLQQPRIPVLIAAHRPRMLRLAARYADIWDTFPTTDGTATQGVTSDLAERVAAFEAACHAAGRDPAGVRRSVWVGPEPLGSQAAYEDFVERHRLLGFTDVTTGFPDSDRWSAVREIATRLISRLRTADAPCENADSIAGVVAAASTRTTS